MHRVGNLLRLSRPVLCGFRRCVLTSAQVTKYQADGYILAPQLQLSEAQLTSGRQALDELLERNPHVMPEQLVNAHLVNGEGSAQGVSGCQTFLALASHPTIVDAVAQCLGTENVILWACQIFCKPAGVGKAVPFHQDGQYWPIEPLRACSAWIALDKSDADNGAIQMVSGSHLQGEIEHVKRIDEDACISYIADPDVVKPLKPKAQFIELDAGQISLHDSMILHGSDVNRSSRRRAGIAATYMPAECHFNRYVQTEGAKKGGLNLDFSSRPLFLVKGSNQNPQNELLHHL